MTAVLDSNIFIYALDPSDPVRHAIAVSVVRRQMLLRPLMLQQVVGEVLNVAHRKQRIALPIVRAWAADVAVFYTILQADLTAMFNASELAERHGLQFWDALICTVARQHGAAILFSEDMQDGMRFGALTVINPFAPANTSIIDEVLGV